MKPRRDEARTEVRVPFKVCPTSGHGSTALRRAEALAVDLSATAAGVFPATPPVLDALAGLATVLLLDLKMVSA